MVFGFHRRRRLPPPRERPRIAGQVVLDGGVVDTGEFEVGFAAGNGDGNVRALDRVRAREQIDRGRSDFFRRVGRDTTVVVCAEKFGGHRFRGPR